VHSGAEKAPVGPGPLQGLAGLGQQHHPTNGLNSLPLHSCTKVADEALQLFAGIVSISWPSMSSPWPNLLYVVTCS